MYLFHFKIDIIALKVFYFFLFCRSLMTTVMLMMQFMIWMGKNSWEIGMISLFRGKVATEQGHTLLVFCISSIVEMNFSHFNNEKWFSQFRFLSVWKFDVTPTQFDLKDLKDLKGVQVSWQIYLVVNISYLNYKSHCVNIILN